MQKSQNTVKLPSENLIYKVSVTDLQYSRQNHYWRFAEPPMKNISHSADNDTDVLYIIFTSRIDIWGWAVSKKHHLRVLDRPERTVYIDLNTETTLYGSKGQDTQRPEV